MKNILTLLLWPLLWLPPLHTLKNTQLSHEEIATLLQNTVEQYHPSLLNAPADITFAVADIKYNNGTFKIIECGNGPYCGLKPHPIIVNGTQQVMTTPYWEVIEHALKRYNIPLWFTGLPLTQPFQFFAQPAATHKKSTSFKDLTAMPYFRRPEAQSKIKPKKIAQHQGIVLYRGSGLRAIGMESFFKFKQHYPAFLLVNSNSSSYFSCKEATFKLFTEAGLSRYLPRHAIYPTSKFKNIANQILHDFINVNFFIIKPLGKYRSFGVGVVPAEYLNQYLHHMFGTTPFAKHEKKSIGYWRENNDTHFMVNEFIASQPIVYNNTSYDPTMRIVVLMNHEAGNISVNVIGGCWKIPPRAINDEQATLTQRHVTDPEYHETDNGILIAPDDLAMMKKVVAPVFAQAYKIMLEKSVILD